MGRLSGVYISPLTLTHFGGYIKICRLFPSSFIYWIDIPTLSASRFFISYTFFYSYSSSSIYVLIIRFITLIFYNSEFSTPLLLSPCRCRCIRIHRERGGRRSRGFRHQKVENEFFIQISVVYAWCMRRGERDRLEFIYTVQLNWNAFCRVHSKEFNFLLLLLHFAMRKFSIELSLSRPLCFILTLPPFYLSSVTDSETQLI